jgi:hypothetical protein
MAAYSTPVMKKFLERLETWARSSVTQARRNAVAWKEVQTKEYGLKKTVTQSVVNTIRLKGPSVRDVKQAYRRGTLLLRDDRTFWN